MQIAGPDFGVAIPASQVGADLDHVPVGVTEVDAADGTGRAGALDRAFLDRDAVRGKFPDHLIQLVGGDQAQVGAAGLGRCAFGSSS